MRTLVVVNPRASRIDDLADVVSVIRRHPALDEPQVRITGAEGDARLYAEAALREGFRRIVAAGGDGTVHEVVGALVAAGSEATLGVLPLGTGNDLARSLDLPLHLNDALDALETARPRTVDLMRVSGALEDWVVNVAAGGLSGDVGAGVTDDVKRSWGPLAYLRSAIDVLPDPRTWWVELDTGEGEPRRTEVLNVVVANGPSAAGGIPVAPRARPDDGLLDVVVLRAAPLSALATLGPRCLVGKHLDHELVEWVQVEAVRVDADPPMPFNLDGEPGASTPMEFQVVPGAIRVLVPPRARPDPDAQP